MIAGRSINGVYLLSAARDKAVNVAHAVEETSFDAVSHFVVKGGAWRQLLLEERLSSSTKRVWLRETRDNSLKVALSSAINAWRV